MGQWEVVVSPGNLEVVRWGSRGGGPGVGWGGEPRTKWCMNERQSDNCARLPFQLSSLLRVSIGVSGDKHPTKHVSQVVRLPSPWCTPLLLHPATSLPGSC